MGSKADQHLNIALTCFTALHQQIIAAENAGLTRKETNELTETNLDACLAALDCGFDAMVAEENSQ